MKTLKYFVLAMFAFLAISCSDDVFTPRDGDEDDDDPVVIGGGGGTGQPGGGGSGGGQPSGGRVGKDNKNQRDSVVVVKL